MDVMRADHRHILTILAATEFGSDIVAVQDLTSGYSGFVYAVALARDPETPIVMKLTPQERDRSITDETLDERVSAVRAGHFDAAYHLLQNSNLPLPTVFVSGQPRIDVPFFYQAMSYLPGISVAPFLEAHKHDAPSALHYLVGQTLGQLHRITRHYDGWIDQPQPYAISWTDAFFASWESKLQAAQQLSVALTDYDRVIRRFLERQQQIWQPPVHFVLSEFTGFQGMARPVSDQWQLTGLIDLEDHRFVDPRYVLGGHELALTLGGGSLPNVFWTGYTEQTILDSSYVVVKDIIQLYYLLSWFPVIFSPNWQGEPSRQQGVIQYFERTICQRCTP